MQEKSRRQPFAAQNEDLLMSDTNALAPSVANLQAAQQRFEQVYLDKPRLAPLMGKYTRAMNNSRYAMRCARERIQYGDPPYKAILLVNKTLHQIDKLIDELKNDPYKCKSQAKIDAWLFHRQTSPTPVRQ